MTEVARALVLPDLDGPGSNLMRNLAIYWDEIVCPTYRDESYLDSEDPLVQNGVVRELTRELAPDTIFPVAEDGVTKDENWAYGVHRTPEGLKVELVPMDESERDRRGPPLKDRTDSELEVLTAISLGQHLGYVDDALAIAASNNLAPISHSLGGHLAAVVGSSEAVPGAPSREAALLSVVVEAFAIDPRVSSEEILRFRDKNSKVQGRLRASLVDLSAQLKVTDNPPATMLAEARDVYRNRVEPALGDLEEVLKEGRIRFFTKSLLGATAVAVAPIEPVSTSVGAARVMGQTIDYSYSKSRLVREHPYGYLHQVRDELGVSPKNRPSNDLETIMMAPRESLWELWLEDWKKGREGQRWLATKT